MKDWDFIKRKIDDEIKYQDAKFEGNDNKPMEVWLLVASGYMQDALSLYAHGTQKQVREKLIKVVTCLVRGLSKE